MHAARHPVCYLRSARHAGFTLTDMLVSLAVVSVLAAVATLVVVRAAGKAKLGRCQANLQQVNRAVLQFATDHREELPRMEGSSPPGGWWWYKESVKGYLGLNGASSVNDLVFACPADRGYGEGPAASQPFCRSARHDFTSYVFNGVNLPGIPNIAGRTVPSIQAPARTLLVMEWTAHAPLSWHRSRTGRANTPFYNDAESVVGFVDGHVALIKVYYDGMNAAFTRDPVPGYAYQYSGD
jgi:prepilin-type N-terminal cleavage/methylation domain-containing protein/prepilin-type processing-associated H-X9-DG protein